MRTLSFPFLLLGTLTLAACTEQRPPASPQSDIETQMLQLVNEARAQSRTCGDTFFPAAPALKWNGHLATAARGHAADMMARGFFDHVTPEGKTVGDRAKAAGYTGLTMGVGENIAQGQPTLAAAVQAWLVSPSHCKTLMSTEYRDLGVGYAPGGSYAHTWVQVFGYR